MNPDVNPYAAPTTFDQAAATAPRKRFPELSTRDLRRLRNASHSIRTLALLWSFGAVGWGIMVVPFLLQPPFFAFPIYVVVGPVLVAAAWGAWTRAKWGRWPGIGISIIVLAGFPIGTLLGILGLMAYVPAKPLFGPDRLRHTELEMEWRYRRRNHVP